MLALILLACAGQASGAGPTRPSSGGSETTSAFDRSVTRIARSLAGPRAAMECVAPGAWRGLAGREGFDPAVTWAMTPLHLADGATVLPDGRSYLGPRACRLASAFASAPAELGTRICSHGTTTRWRTSATQHPVRRRVRVPLLGECDQWGSKLVALHVIGHESMHLAGVVDEAAADCLAVQLDAYVAVRLGASASFARSLADEYWRSYYPAQDARYRSTSCHDGGALDLFRDRAGWPTPSRYPPNAPGLIASFSTSVGAATSLEAGADP